MKIFLIEIKGTSNYAHNGLAYLAGNLSSSHKLKIFDFNVSDLEEEELLHEIKKENPDFIGFSIKSFNLKNTLEFAKKIKQISHAKLICGGPHITLCAKDFFARDNKDIFDFGFQGEAELSFSKFCDYFGIDENYKDVEGLIYKNREDWTFNSKLVLDNLDLLKIPDFGCFYKKIDFEKQDGYPLLTSRGCPYQCVYCSVSKVSGAKWRARTPENIVSELKEAVLRFNIKSFKVVDDNFTLDMNRAKKFCRLLIGEKLNLRWSCPNGVRADRIDEELADLMKESGCHAVSLGIESGDEKVFDFINKGEKLQDIKKAVDIFTRAGIEVSGFFIIGLPFETKKSIKKSLKFIESLGIKHIKWNMLVPYPETFLWDWVLKNGKFLKDFTYGQHFSKKFNVSPVFETPDYSMKQRIKSYKIANLSTGAYFYVFKIPKNKFLFYLKYSGYLLWYNPKLLFRKIIKKFLNFKIRFVTK